jgi:PPM family protein phosphatase
MTTLRAGGLTDVGRVRSVNQDRVYFDDILFAIADGMGGHAGGEVAAATAIESLRQAFAHNASGGGLTEAVQTANLAVWEQARTDAELRGMGTTITAAALVSVGGSDNLALVNVGDSRAYLFRGGRLEQLTEDHSVVEEMVRAGELSAGEAAVHPSRHILTRALGVEPDVEVDHWSLRPVAGDRFILCSDGLFNEVGDDEITTVLARFRDPQPTADELVHLARAHGGSDNITVLVIDVIEGPADATAPGQGAAALGGTAIGAPAAAIGPDRPVGPGDGDDSPDVTSGDPSASAGGQHSGPSATSGASAGPQPATGAVAARLDATTASTVTTVVPAVGPAGASVYSPHPAAAPPAPSPPASSAQASATDVAAPSTLPPTARPGGPGEPALPKPRRSRRITFRVVLFLLVLAVLVAGAIASVKWFADRSYFVGLDHSQIVIYRGQPGGTLWFQPEIIQRTGLTTASVLPSRVPDLRHGTQEPSLDAARRYVANLTAEARSLPSTSTTSTTAPAAPPGGPVFP